MVINFKIRAEELHHQPGAKVAPPSPHNKVGTLKKKSGRKPQPYTYFHPNFIDFHEHLHTPKDS